MPCQSLPCKLNCFEFYPYGLFIHQAAVCDRSFLEVSCSAFPLKVRRHCVDLFKIITFVVHKLL